MLMGVGGLGHDVDNFFLMQQNEAKMSSSMFILCEQITLLWAWKRGKLTKCDVKRGVGGL